MMFPKLIARANLRHASKTGHLFEFEEMLPLMRELSHAHGLYDEEEIVRFSIRVMNEAAAIVERYLDMRARQSSTARRPDPPSRLH